MVEKRNKLAFLKKNWTTPASFLFIFVLFRHKLYRKICRLQRDSNLDRRREGNHFDWMLLVMRQFLPNWSVLLHSREVTQF